MTTTKTTRKTTAKSATTAKAETPAKPSGIAALAAQAKARRTAQAAKAEAPQATGMITEQNQPKQERKIPDFWVNIGYSIPDEDGEEVFISLPVGISLDTQPDRKLNSTDPKINQINAARNHLLKILREDAEAMQAGTSQLVEFLQVQLLRRTEEGKGVLDANHNPFILDELKYVEDGESEE